MQHVNDDMDELFRRAAENYPLDTTSADWNKVLAAMQGQANSVPVPERKRNNKGRLLWLLLLLPLGLICNQLYTPGDLNKNTISDPQARKQNPPANKNSNTAAQNKLIDANITVGTANPTKENPDIQSTTIPYSDRFSGTPGNLYSSHAINFSGKNTAYSARNTKIISQTKPGQPPTDYHDFITGESDLFRKYVSEIELQRELLKTPAFVINESMEPIANRSEANSKKNLQIQKPKRFYAGLMGGIDATTVKFQKVENKGFDYGLLLGYVINKKWAIETGAYVENKYYYSEGKYFNTSKVYMPPNSRISEVSGGCKMIEVPLSLKYNFSPNKKSGWFSTLGTSSYFMREEDYTYMYYYGSVGPVPHRKIYKNSSTNLFSNISISGGYTHSLGKFADLRIEPYLKIPISGMGIGKLPLFSTGLQIGITKKF